MKRFNKKQSLLFFYTIDFILLLIFILLIIPFSRKTKNFSKKSALLNPKYKNSVEKIELNFPSESEEFSKNFTFYKKGNFWFGEMPVKKSSVSFEFQIAQNNDYDKIYFPLDNQTLNNMLEKFTLIVNMYKKSDSQIDFSSFNLLENESTCILFYNSNNEILSKIYFGKEDDFTSRIAFRVPNQNEVWETDNSFSVYINSQISFWADPFLEPQCITRYPRKESESSLRHGKILENFLPDDFVSSESLKKDFGNGNEILYEIFKNDSKIFFKAKFVPGSINSQIEKDALLKANYVYSISEWTYEKFLESF